MHNQIVDIDWRSFKRFIVTGTVNTAFGYGLFALLIFIGLHYALASLFSTVLGILFNFFTVGRFVFHNMDKNRLPWFIAVYGITYILGIVGLSLLDALGLDMYRAGILMIPPSAIISYILNCWFVFGGKK